jgi:hypothetical protein
MLHAAIKTGWNYLDGMQQALAADKSLNSEHALHGIRTHLMDGKQTMPVKLVSRGLNTHSRQSGKSSH